MFDKYNLVHFEVTKPLVSGGNNQYDKAVKVTESDIPQSLPAVADTFRSMDSASYRIAGSFDYLLPVIRKNAPDEFSESVLYLQSFGVMNSSSDYYTRRSLYDSLLFSYTYSGEGGLTYNGKNYALAAGSGFVIDCRLPHEYHTISDHWKHVDIHLWGLQAEALYKCFQRVGVVSFSYSATAINRLLEELLESYTNHSDLRNLYVGSALSNILCAVLRKAEKDGVSNIPLTYRRLVRYMESNYMHALSLDEVAAQFHISKFHMSREFRKYTGYAPGEYLIMLRIQHASILLAQSDLSIEAIAEQAGFSNMSNFIGQIKKRTGMTPSEFRRMCKANR